MTDSFDSPDGRTYSTPETAGQAATPGQADPSLGQVFWDAYSGNPLQWKHLGEGTKAAVECGAQAVRAAIAAAAPAPAGESGMLLSESQQFQLSEARDILATWDANSPGGISRETVLADQVRALLAIVDQHPARLDLARAETAAIRAAGANTARDLAEVTAERDKLRELIASGEPLTVKPADDVKAAPELAAAMAETRKVREVLANVFGSFSQPDSRRTRHASVPASLVDRWKRDAGMQP